MSELMTDAVMAMPFEMAMGDELSRYQFFSRAKEVHAEMLRLQERERNCPTMQEAESRSMLRALQECGDALGLETPSPADIVAAVQAKCRVIH